MSERHIQNLKRYLIWFFSRTVTVLTLFFLITSLFVDYAKISRKANAKFLNDFMPSVSYFLNYQDQKTEFNEQTFKDLIFYYKKILEYIPERPDIHSLLGYCYYQLGNTKKAISYYQKAIQVNPIYTGPYNNLGNIYFSQYRLKEAEAAFEKSLSINPSDERIQKQLSAVKQKIEVWENLPLYNRR